MIMARPLRAEVIATRRTTIASMTTIMGTVMGMGMGMGVTIITITRPRPLKASTGRSWSALA